jgi:hypothetical protein
MPDTAKTATSEPPGYANAQASGRPDVEEWAEREHRRRQGWLAGPSEAERYEYAVMNRARGGLASLVSLGSPPLMPTDAEVDEWAARETARRQAWVDGPSQTERMTYGTQRSMLSPGTVQVDVDEWAAREHDRRVAWAAGPSEAEKHDWAVRHTDRSRAYYTQAGPYVRGVRSDYAGADALPPIAAEIRDLARLAMAGAAYRAFEYPYEALGHLVQAGMDLQESLVTPRFASRRVPF